MKFRNALPTLRVVEPPMTARQARDLGALFKIFSSETRLRLLEALVRSGELCVNDLSARVELAPQAVSNQLRRLLALRIVATRRHGNQIFYRIFDPCVPRLLELGACLVAEGRKAGR